MKKRDKASNHDHIEKHVFFRKYHLARRAVDKLLMDHARSQYLLGDEDSEYYDYDQWRDHGYDLCQDLIPIWTLLSGSGHYEGEGCFLDSSNYGEDMVDCWYRLRKAVRVLSSAIGNESYEQYDEPAAKGLRASREAALAAVKEALDAIPTDLKNFFEKWKL